jgi:hypothetical protein
MFKGLDQMALPYIERAASKVPYSRDIAALKAHIPTGERPFPYCARGLLHR